MLPTHALLRQQLQGMIDTLAAEGHAVEPFRADVEDAPDSYDALAELAEKIASAPLRSDWPYEEPDTLEDIRAEADPNRPTGAMINLDLDDASARMEEAFLAAVAGCILGKPLEVNPTLEEIRTAAMTTNEWPLRNYVSLAMMEAMPRKHHRSVAECCRETIRHVATDDDINYSILGMLLLEKYGLGFTKHHVLELWLKNLPPMYTFGPERLSLIKASMRTLGGGPEDPFEGWIRLWNPEEELCGACIRDDAYGYACPARPELAAELAWRDASWTHRRTGVYASMYIAATIAAAVAVDDPVDAFRVALGHVPQNSRFAHCTREALEMVDKADNWLDAYEAIHGRFRQWGHCGIYQEIGTMINTARFAHDVNEAIGMQVAQGNDTDCFGEIIGSILGAYYGEGGLDRDHWIKPFHDRIHTSLGDFHEQSLMAVTKRMGRLCRLTEKQLRTTA